MMATVPILTFNVCSLSFPFHLKMVACHPVNNHCCCEGVSVSVDVCVAAFHALVEAHERSQDEWRLPFVPPQLMTWATSVDDRKGRINTSFTKEIVLAVNCQCQRTEKKNILSNHGCLSWRCWVCLLTVWASVYLLTHTLQSGWLKDYVIHKHFRWIKGSRLVFSTTLKKSASFQSQSFIQTTAIISSYN